MIKKNENIKYTVRHMNALSQYVPVKEYVKKSVSGRVYSVYFTAGKEYKTRSEAVQSQINTFNTLVNGGIYSSKEVDDLLSWKMSRYGIPLFKII